MSVHAPYSPFLILIYVRVLYRGQPIMTQTSLDTTLFPSGKRLRNRVSHIGHGPTFPG
jgi:hypothetical protein